MFECVHAIVTVRVGWTLWVPMGFVWLALHHFTPIPFLWSRPTPKTRPERLQELNRPHSVLKLITCPCWWYFSYTTCFLNSYAVQRIGKPIFGAVLPHALTAPACELACLLALSLPHTNILYSVCTVISFIPRWVWSNDFYAVKPGHSLSSIQRLYQI